MTVFKHELTTWGPKSSYFQGTDAPVSLAQANAYCRKIALGHYENFPVVSWFLPLALRQHFFNVYAFCRWADDLGDEVPDSESSLALLTWWRSQLVACYQRLADTHADRQTDMPRLHPVFVALTPTIAEFDLPQALFDDLIQAFEQDQTVTEYQSFEQLLQYCQKSANPVGRLVLHLCRAVSPANLKWSDSICTGLQLANFWQDVARDFAIGRVYLPQEDCQQYGYTKAQLEQNEFNESFQELMKFEVQRARQYLLDGLPLISQLPGRLQIDIDLFVRGGLKILSRIERLQFNVWRKRPIVSRFDFMLLLLQSFVRRFFRS